MITLCFTLTNPDNIMLKESIEQYGDRYPEILDVCGHFRIYINGRCYFDEPQFPIIELILFLKHNIINCVSCEFDSIETEDNPLFTFRYINGHWKVSSKWQLYSANDYIPHIDLLDSIYSLEKSVNLQLANFGKR